MPTATRSGPLAKVSSKKKNKPLVAKSSSSLTKHAGVAKPKTKTKTPRVLGPDRCPHRQARPTPAGLKDGDWWRAYNSADSARYALHGKNSILSAADRDSGLTRIKAHAEVARRIGKGKITQVGAEYNGAG